MKNGHRAPIGRVPLTDSTSRNSRRFQRNSACVATPAGGTAEPQAGGSIQEFSLSGRELEASAARGGEGGVPLRGIVPPRGVHRDQPGSVKPGGGEVLQQARDSRAVNKGRQAGGRDDGAFLSSLSRQ